MQETLQKLRQLHQEALSELNKMKWQQIHFERYEDYERGYANGHEEALHEFENLVDDITKILREVDIEEVMSSNPVVSEKQQPLFAIPTHPATQYVTVSPDGKHTLIQELGLSEDDFYTDSEVD